MLYQEIKSQLPPAEEAAEVIGHFAKLARVAENKLVTAEFRITTLDGRIKELLTTIAELKSQSHAVPELPGKTFESLAGYGDLAVSTLDRKFLLLRKELYEERNRLVQVGTCTTIATLDRALRELHLLLLRNVLDVQPREDISPRSYAAAQGLSTNHSGRMQSSTLSGQNSYPCGQSQDVLEAERYINDRPTI